MDKDGQACSASMASSSRLAGMGAVPVLSSCIVNARPSSL